ncbi:MAG: hypothetical protein SF029_26100 [bacterium]|nr:hypothetical protein [bacterium]
MLFRTFISTVAAAPSSPTPRSSAERHTVDKPTLTHLFMQHYQANRLLWEAVMTLDDAQFMQPLMEGRPSIYTQIVEMVANENLWVNYLWHGQVEFLQPCQLPTRACICCEWDALEEELLDFLDELTPADLEERIAPGFLNHVVRLSVGESLLQVVQQAAESRRRLWDDLRYFGFTVAPASSSIS